MTATDRALVVFRSIQQYGGIDGVLSSIVRAIEDAVAQEREACAKIAETCHEPSCGVAHVEQFRREAGQDIAAAIRTRVEES